MSDFYSQWYENFVESMGMYGDDSLFDALHSLINSSKNVFSMNKKLMQKTIDTAWVEAIETGLEHVDNVLRNPRKTIENVEEVVPIALSKKITVDSIKHLAQHTDLIQSIDEKTGKITPSKILNVHKEETLQTYENKFVNTLIDRLYIFIFKRYEKLKAVSQDEEAFTLEYSTEIGEETGRRMSMSLKIETVDNLDAAGTGGSTLWQRVEKIKKIIESYKASSFVAEMNGSYIRPPVMRTNAIMKNVDLKACLVLWQFIESYEKVGYEIEISDTAQKPSQNYIEDLYNLVALNFLLFRSYTKEDSTDFTELKTKKSRALAPKIVRKFEKQSSESYDAAIDAEGGVITTNGEFEISRRLPADAPKIIEEINAVIKIEKQYFENEEKKRREAERIAEEKERKAREEEERKREEARIAEEKRLERIREEERIKRLTEEERRKEELLAEKKREQERIEREAEEKRLAEAAAKKAEEDRIAAEERARIEEEERIEREQFEKEEQERLERERIEEEKIDKLKAEREKYERKSFKEIYQQYSHNPYHILKRNVKRLYKYLTRNRVKKVVYPEEHFENLPTEPIARLKAKREFYEKQRFEDLYFEYSRNPVHVVMRSFKKLMRKLKNNEHKKTENDHEKDFTDKPIENIGELTELAEKTDGADTKSGQQ